MKKNLLLTVVALLLVAGTYNVQASNPQNTPSISQTASGTTSTKKKHKHGHNDTKSGSSNNKGSYTPKKKPYTAGSSKAS